MNVFDWILVVVGLFLWWFYVYNGGFLMNCCVKCILDLCGFDIWFGKLCEGDVVGIWG